ncbi:MAG: Hsp20/alpha crystallin family protein [Promethearchaeota archaeon]|jgi:HSP20 family molecular chaperone IbpA
MQEINEEGKEEVKEEIMEKEEIKEEIVKEEKKADKFIISPDLCAWADDSEEVYKIEIQLPGVDKEDIKLKMHEDSFFIKGETDDTIYIGSYGICCPVIPEETKAVYHQGLLKIDVPFKESVFHSVDVNIE